MLLCCFPNCSTACEHFLWNCLVLAPSCGSVFLIVNWNSPSFYYYYSCLALKISFWHWKAVLGMLTYIRAPGIPLMQEDGPAPAVLPGTLGLASHWRSQQGFLLKIWCSVRFGYIYTLIKPQFIPERPCHMSLLLVSPCTFFTLADPFLELREAEDTSQVERHHL